MATAYFGQTDMHETVHTINLSLNEVVVQLIKLETRSAQSLGFKRQKTLLHVSISVSFFPTARIEQF